MSLGFTVFLDSKGEGVIWGWNYYGILANGTDVANNATDYNPHSLPDMNEY